jgi:hypothetical protein
MKGNKLMKNLPYTAETDIEGYRLVTFGTNDGEVKPTTAKTDPVIGVTNYIGAPKGTTVDVNVDNVGKVKLSGGKCASRKLSRLGNAATLAHKQLHRLALNPCRSVDRQLHHVVAGK